MDSHADDIIQIVWEEFGEGNEFCKKITYQAETLRQSILKEAFEGRLCNSNPLRQQWLKWLKCESKKGKNALLAVKCKK